MSQHSTPVNQYINLVSKDGLDYLTVNHPKASAEISLFGGHLLSYVPVNEKPVIWLSDNAIFDGKKAIRGGVPICWPWFGPATNNPPLSANPNDINDLPSHGFARNSVWRLEDTSTDETQCKITLSLSDSPASLSIWPHKFKLLIEFIIAEELSITLTTHNLNDHAIEYGGTIHTYLHISSPESVSVAGFTSKDLEVDNEIDQIFNRDAIADQIDVLDSQYQRKITTQYTGNNTVVLWNPWIEKAKAFMDMPDNGYQQMLCVEPTITAQSVTIPAGESHQLGTVISVEKNPV